LEAAEFNYLSVIACFFLNFPVYAKVTLNDVSAIYQHTEICLLDEVIMKDLRFSELHFCPFVVKVLFSL